MACTGVDAFLKARIASVPYSWAGEALKHNISVRLHVCTFARLRNGHLPGLVLFDPMCSINERNH